MFRKILFPIDFSETAFKALEYIKHMKKTDSEEVILLHVIHRRVIETIAKFEVGRYEVSKKESLAEAEKRIEIERIERLQPIVDELEKLGFKVKARVEKGVPIKSILAVEKEEQVSVTVIGSHGKENLTELFMGSVSEGVIRRSKNPVLVVKRDSKVT